MRNFIHQHDQKRSLRHQPYPLGLPLVLHRTQSELADDMHYCSMERGSCVKGIISYHLERTPHVLIVPLCFDRPFCK